MSEKIIGSKCKVCGACLRYKSDGNCVACSIKKAKQASKEKSLEKFDCQPRIDSEFSRTTAIKKRDKFFIGGNCRYHGSVLRYTSNKRCVKCSQIASKEQNRKIREEIITNY